MGATALFTRSPVALFFAARGSSGALRAVRLVLPYLLPGRLRCRRWLAVVLTGVVGLFPMTSMLSSSVQSDSLSFTLATLALLAALEVRRRPNDLRGIAVLGVGLGLLLVTKVHFFALVGTAVGAMIVTQRFEARDARRWPVESALLAVPAIALESIQVWTQWGSTPLIAAGQLGELPNYRTALAGGVTGIAGYIGRITSFTFLDHTFGREFTRFWGVFGWVDTPLVLGSPVVTVALCVLIAGISI